MAGMAKKTIEDTFEGELQDLRKAEAAHETTIEDAEHKLTLVRTQIVAVESMRDKLLGAGDEEGGES